ncbi:MAG: endonuclease/exonuclease/phosphatase family protein [Nocardioides sp.]
MRIVTWNVAGKWRTGHQDLLHALDADVLLLTEVPIEGALEGYHQHTSRASMAGSTKKWAAVFARSELTPLPDPHPASAAAVVGGATVISSIMPWPRAGTLWPWGSPDHTERMAETASAVLETVVPGETIWGGDWNTPLTGNLSGFARASQAALLDALNGQPFQVPTKDLLAKSDLQSSIDHIAVPDSWETLHAERVRTDTLSDHDAYWIEVLPHPS